MSELNQQAHKITQEINELSRSKEEITLPKGKLTLEDLSQHELDNVEIISGLDFAIDRER